MAKEINFLENKTYVGIFNLFSQKYSGKLIYENRKTFELTLYEAPVIMLKHKPSSITEMVNKAEAEPLILDTITGIIYDEDDNRYNITLANCSCIQFPLIGNGCAKFIFDYALFSDSHIFDLENDKNFKINLFFNNWNEFCYPQGFKSLVTVSNKNEMEVVLKNNLKISFSENVSGELINTDDLFSNLFVSCGKDCLKQQEIVELNQQLKDLVKPYKNKLFKKRDETHRWYISVENVSNTNSISSIIWKFNMLINILTFDFSTAIDMVQLQFETNDKSTPSAKFYYLCNSSRSNKKSSYSCQQSAFKCKSFSKKEWNIILVNLFKHKNKDWLTNFFYVLSENNSSNPLTIFHITRYIDYIGAIGVSKKYGKLKYEKVLLDYIQDLDSNLKQATLSAFRHNLSIIKIQNNKQRNWKLMGKKLCEFRAYAAHIEEKRRILSFFKAHKVYKILELILIDNVFEVLGVSKDKRLKYKTYYLKKLIRSYVKQDVNKNENNE